ncbi:hypothetical protein MLD38_025977 [Melastoma candidum]|uniref:Uncharacterized protein n=1 Tax=Melastoma candidum TaxID=119954 RepID=A0ACB9NXJ4_9MYRT|nr:hypothetical protein MLD38_025977 [Melastoma candidum]
MWAIQRASRPLNFSFRVLRSTCAQSTLEIGGGTNEVSGLLIPPRAPAVTLAPSGSYYHGARTIYVLSSRCHSLSTQAGAKNDGEEDAFSELEEPVSTVAIEETPAGEDGDDDLECESELSDDVDVGKASRDDLDLSEHEADSTEQKQSKKSVSNLFKAISSAQGSSIQHVMEKWTEEGKELDEKEIAMAMLNLRQRKMYIKGLQLSEWWEKSRETDFTERHYASRVDLIAKVRGPQKAEGYISQIPESFRGEVVYRSLLANYVAVSNVKKAEDTFNRMRNQFPLTAFACNQLLILYKRLDKRKIADVLLLMEKENVKPTLFTYKLLIDTKGKVKDIPGMEKILETMQAEGVEPDKSIECLLARHYVAAGKKDKAKSVLKKIEGDELEQNRWTVPVLLPLYADLGESEEVERLWKACKVSPRASDTIAAIEAWLKLKNLDAAEAAFEALSRSVKLTSRHYASLLRVYASNKMLAKGKEVVKQMAESGCHIGPTTWDSLVKLYVEAGEVEKADSILQKASQQNQRKPLFSSYMTLLEQYAKRGDVHNAEKTLHRLRQMGYTSRSRPYQSLIQAYIKGKVPAYGFRDRLRADGIVISKAMDGQLALIDPFKKSAVTDLLD